jgi:hypothetical protein
MAKPANVISDTTGSVLQQGNIASAAAPARDTTQRTPLTATPSPAPTTVVDSAPRPVPAPASATPAIAPRVSQGRTDLPDGLFAVRSGDTVAVHFDRAPARTRRADKFERIVRQTLRAVYGPVADTLLGVVPDGRLATNADLVTSLPGQGIRIYGPSGRRLAIWPETRAGRDGPLVVGYRVTIER